MNRVIIAMIFLLLGKLGYCQDEVVEKLEPPDFKLFRAEENYNYLKDKENNPYQDDYMDAIKFISLNHSRNINLRFGGEIRSRIEHYTNRRWTKEDETFYSQRLSLHTNINIGNYIKVFGELYHGLVSKEAEFAESVKLDLHQAFIAFKIPFNDKQNLDIRFGRQELALGSARLIGLRECLNIRRSFDMGRMHVSCESSQKKPKLHM